MKRRFIINKYFSFICEFILFALFVGILVYLFYCGAIFIPKISRRSLLFAFYYLFVLYTYFDFLRFIGAILVDLCFAKTTYIEKARIECIEPYKSYHVLLHTKKQNAKKDYFKLKMRVKNKYITLISDTYYELENSGTYSVSYYKNSRIIEQIQKVECQ